MHGDAALDEKARTAQMPRGTLTGEANLLVLPNIDAANIAYNLLKTAAGGGIAIGPILLGAAAPVHVLTPSTTVRRLVNMTALTVADANAGR
jgi:malate dehydrogenase (oxaloacetate-decarboxylating)(NADP+)